jgi:hypothetical protein
MYRYGANRRSQRCGAKALELNRVHRGSIIAGLVLLILTVGSLGIPVRGAGGTQFASALTPLLDSANGNAIGTVNPGTGVNVAEQSGALTHVTLQGWSTPKKAGSIYVAPDRQIVELSGFKGHATPGSSQTAGGATYTAVTVDGWIATSALVDNMQPIWTAAAALYAQKCGTCHAAMDPSSNSVNDWPDLVQTWAPSANLDATQTALLTAYLQAQSKN